MTGLPPLSATLKGHWSDVVCAACRWNDAEHSVAVQEGANYGLGAAYCLIGLIAVVQLVRIQLRVPEYGWTTQKVFHLLNFIVCAVRGSTFLLRDQLEKVHPAAVRVVLFDLPGAQASQRFRIGVRLTFGAHGRNSASSLASLRRFCAVLSLLTLFSLRFKQLHRPALLHHIHLAGAVLGGDLLPGAQHTHNVAAAALCRRQRRHLPGHGEEKKACVLPPNLATRPVFPD